MVHIRGNLSRNQCLLLFQVWKPNWENLTAKHNNNNGFLTQYKPFGFSQQLQTPAPQSVVDSYTTAFITFGIIYNNVNKLDLPQAGFSCTNRTIFSEARIGTRRYIYIYSAAFSNVYKNVRVVVSSLCVFTKLLPQISTGLILACLRLTQCWENKNLRKIVVFDSWIYASAFHFQPLEFHQKTRLILCISQVLRSGSQRCGLLTCVIFSFYESTFLQVRSARLEQPKRRKEKEEKGNFLCIR